MTKHLFAALLLASAAPALSQTVQPQVAKRRDAAQKDD
jgi:hypothetical protein